MKNKIKNQTEVEEKWKVYTVYSDSHKQMYEKWFKGTMKDDFIIISRKIKQSCKSAEYMSEGWVSSVLNKIPLIEEAIKDNRKRGFFIFSDVDIQWFKPTKSKILKLLTKNKKIDLFFQRDDINPRNGLPYFCTGFFICRANKRTHKFWKKVKETMKKNRWGDQKSANEVIDKKIVKGLRVAHLPFKFWGARSNSLKKEKWEKGMPLYPPKNILIHHANWTVGVDNKIRQLKYVSDMIKKNKTKYPLFNKTLLTYSLYTITRKPTWAIKYQKKINEGQSQLYKRYNRLYQKYHEKNIDYDKLYGLIGTKLKNTAPIVYTKLKPYFPDKEVNKNEK